MPQQQEQHERSRWAHRQELLCICLLIAMFLAMAGTLNPSDPSRYRSGVLGQMTSALLLPAMGLLLTMRLRMLDLSVWVVFAGANLAAAWLMLCGWQPAGAIAAVTLGGACVGVVNALLVRYRRLPAILATLATGLTIYLLLTAQPHASLRLPQETFEGWNAIGSPWGEKEAYQPLFQTRILLVILAYAATMATLLAGSRKSAEQGPSLPLPALKMLALIASGTLSALGGALRLLDSSEAVAPHWPVGSLQVLVAPVLAGALLMEGPRRTLLSAVCLPPALMLATTWHIYGWPLECGEFPLQLPLLLAAGLVMTLAGRATLPPGPRNLFMGASILAAAGVIAWCVSTNFFSILVLDVLRWAGVILVAAGAGLYLGLMLSYRSRDCS